MSRESRNKSTFTTRYTGELATPIYEPLVCVGGLGASEAEAERRAFERWRLKIGKLFDWYAIDPKAPNAWKHLAIMLASDHVPGMQVRYELQKRRGRKPSWKDGMGFELVRDVAELQSTKEMNYAHAIAELRKNKEKPWHRYTPSNLITRHREARKVAQNRRRLVEQLETSPLWKLGVMFGPYPTDENSSNQN
jgi:hypothetical protein